MTLRLYLAAALVAVAFFAERAWMKHRLDVLGEKVPQLELEIDTLKARQALFSQAVEQIAQADAEAEAEAQQTEERIDEIAEPENRDDRVFWRDFFNGLREQDRAGSDDVSEPSLRETGASENPDRK